METTTADVPREAARRARDDVGVFAEVLVGEGLWPHQLEVARSDARIRCLLAGRQSGKSRTLAVVSLWTAFAAAERRVLVVSAGEEAARSLLQEMAALCRSPLLAGSVTDDEVTRITLSNGSTIRSVPASTKQIRGKAVDLLVIDEACFVDDETWQAAKYTVIARPGAKVLAASTPFGRRDAWFATHWRAGQDGGDTEVSIASWRWPSTVSPLVDREMLAQWRATETDRAYAMEVLAEWADEAGAYFTSDELETSVADYQLIDPVDAHGQLVSGGVDWGWRRDANTLVLLAVLDDADSNRDQHPDDLVYFIAHLEEHYKLKPRKFIDRIVEVADPERGFWVHRLASETNGVGDSPTIDLQARMWRERTRTGVAPVHTTGARKENSYGTIKLMLQQGRLVLPRHPALLRQLGNTEFEVRPTGSVHISVPERLGHDDLVDALAGAISTVKLGRARPDLDGWGEVPGSGEILTTGAGTRIRERPRCMDYRGAFRWPKGADPEDRGW